MAFFIKRKREDSVKKFYKLLWKAGYWYCLMHPETTLRQLAHMLRAWADTLESEDLRMRGTNVVRSTATQRG